MCSSDVTNYDQRNVSRPEISSKTILLSHSSVTLLYSMDTCTVWFIVKSDRDYAQEQLAT